MDIQLRPQHKFVLIVKKFAGMSLQKKNEIKV